MTVLFQPSLIISSKVFQVIFIHLVHNSALFFHILLLFILITRHSQFDLYHHRFSSTVSTFNSRKISSFLLWSRRVYPAVLLKNFISNDVNNFLSFILRAQFCFYIKEWGQPVQYILLFLKI